MRLGKFYSLFAGAFLVALLGACTNTVSSTDSSKLDGINIIPDFSPGSTDSSQADIASSSSLDDSTAVGSSSSEEGSSSSEVAVDFGDSKIQVDGSGIAIITEDYLESVEKSVKQELDGLKDELDNNGNPSGFSESKGTEFAVDDLDFSKSKYYCFTDADEWMAITKEKLLETKLPFLWDMAYYEYRDRYSLSFEDVCVSIYVKSN